MTKNNNKNTASGTPVKRDTILCHCHWIFMVKL